MSWFEPSRIPAWLAPVCEERSGSHSSNLCEPSASHSRHVRRAAVTHRAPQHRQCEPVDLEEDDPRHVGSRRPRPVFSRSAGRRGACTCRRRSCEKITSRTTLTAATTSAASSAHQKLSTSNESRMSLPILSATAFAISTRMKPSASMNGSRSAASSGGMIALMAATTAAIARAPPVATTSTPGRSRAVAHRDTAVRTHEIRSRKGRKRGRSGCQRTVSPYPVTRARSSSPPSFPRAAPSARRPWPWPRCRTRRRATCRPTSRRRRQRARAQRGRSTQS